MQRQRNAVVDLSERVQQLTSDPEAPADDLQRALEELAVAQEELRAQNEELVKTRQRADRERRRYAELFDLAPEPYIVTDANGTIREANRAAAEMLGMRQRSMAGKPLTVFVALEDRQVFRTLVTEAARKGSIRDRTVRFTSPAGDVRYASINASASGDLPLVLRWVLLDVSERVRHEHELQALTTELDQRVAERTEQLQHAIAAKDEFLGMVSHELRTPITTILGNAEVLRRRIDQLSAQDRLTAVTDIEGEGGRLLRLIDDLLLLAKIESRDQELEPLLVDRVTRRVAAACERVYHRKVVVRASADVPAALGDATYLEQVLRNLVGNAAKYTPPETAIEIGIARNDGQIVVSVGDRGPGIPEEELDKVFEAFYRARGSADRTTGQGLGLAVARRLVEAQGGVMWARQREGGGTEFAFTLPLDPDWA